MKKTRFAECLQRIMTEKNLSQSELARMIWGTMTDERGYTVARNRQVLGKYLSGKVEPRTSTKRRMAEVLGVPFELLDPSSDPLNRPGSGLYVEEVDNKYVRVEVKLVIPRDLLPHIVDLVGRYAA